LCQIYRLPKIQNRGPPAWLALLWLLTNGVPLWPLLWVCKPNCYCSLGTLCSTPSTLCSAQSQETWPSAAGDMNSTVRGQGHHECEPHPLRPLHMDISSPSLTLSRTSGPIWLFRPSTPAMGSTQGTKGCDGTAAWVLEVLSMSEMGSAVSLVQFRSQPGSPLGSRFGYSHCKGPTQTPKSACENEWGPTGLVLVLVHAVGAL